MTNKNYKLIEKLVEVKLPNELVQYWKKLDSQKFEDREFYYKYFGKITPMSPDRMTKYSSLASIDGNKYSFFKKIEELSKAEKISETEENEITTNSLWDPYVMTIQLRSELDKYCHLHYIKYCIPIATLYRASELVFIGFTESKEEDGIFYYNANFQDYPVFICKTIEEFTGKVNKEKSCSERLLKELGEDYCYQFCLNEDFELDEQEIDKIFQFICDSFNKIFNIEIIKKGDEESIELCFEYRGYDRFHKFKKSNLKFTESLQVIIMSINNSITELDKNFLNNYKYYLTDETIQVLHNEQAVEFVREGLILPYSKNPIPQRAYTSKGKRIGKYDSELLEMIKDRNWTQAEVDRFLHIYGDIGFTNKYQSDYR